MLTFLFCFCLPHHVYIATDLKTVLVAIAPHMQGIFVKVIGWHVGQLTF